MKNMRIVVTWFKAAAPASPKPRPSRQGRESHDPSDHARRGVPGTCAWTGRAL
jgi:hypothetical protein